MRRFPLPLGLLLLIVCSAIQRLSAAPVVYTLTGYIQASGGGTQADTSFTWTVFADTAGIVTTSPGQFQNAATSSSINFKGIGTQTYIGVTVYLNTTTGQVTFGNIAKGGIGLTNAQLKTWDLSSPIGPLSGTNFLVPGTLTGVDGAVVTLLGVANTSNGPSPAFQSAAPSPTIVSVVNAASGIAQGLPNAGIAQGAIFVVAGIALGPADISIASAAFQATSLSNTSVAVTVGGTTVNALMYYTSAGQVAALLPSNTPVGAGTVTVTYNGKTSAASPVTVVPNNVGIFTVSSNGQGPGVVTYADYSLVSASKAANCGGPNTTCGAANPGDTLILWATGLGPVSGSDAAGAGLGQNMPNIPLKVWLGGVQVPVVYQGRSGCCAGEDQIVFTVPNNVPIGCAVPLSIQIGNQISNSAVMPVANGSRTCASSNPALASINVQQVVAAGPFNYGQIKLSRDVLGPGLGQADNATIQFIKILGYVPGTEPFFASYLDGQPLGTCTVINSLDTTGNTPIGNTSSADAGSSFTVTGPNGSKVLAGRPGKFNATLSANATFLSPGAYTVAGTGGVDIAGFNAAFTIPPVPVLTNPANFNLPPVTRANGLTINWTGGAQNADVQVQLSSATDDNETAGATAICTAAASAGQMTIPPYVLQALPAGTFGGLLFTPRSLDVPFTAKGLGVGVIKTAGSSTFIGNVTFR